MVMQFPLNLKFFSSLSIRIVVECETAVAKDAGSSPTSDTSPVVYPAAAY